MPAVAGLQKDSGGSGFAGTQMKGSDHNDEFTPIMVSSAVQQITPAAFWVALHLTADPNQVRFQARIDSFQAATDRHQRLRPC